MTTRCVNLWSAESSASTSLCLQRWRSSRPSIKVSRNQGAKLTLLSAGQMVSECSRFISLSLDNHCCSGWWLKKIYQPLTYFTSIWLVVGVYLCAQVTTRACWLLGWLCWTCSCTWDSVSDILIIGLGFLCLFSVSFVLVGIHSTTAQTDRRWTFQPSIHHFLLNIFAQFYNRQRTAYPLQSVSSS